MKLLRDYPSKTALFVLSISVLVLIGWKFDIQVFKSLHPNYITMKFNTALSFLMASVALMSLRRRHAFSYGLSILFPLLIIALCVGTLTEYLAGIDLGIDQLFIRDLGGINGRFPPGRLAPITAVNFIALSIALLIERWRDERFFVLSRLLAVVVLFASFQSVVGYLIGLTYLFGSAYYTQMALHTSIAFVALSLGVLLLHPDRSFLQAFTVHTRTAIMMRWMLLTAVVLPLLARWLAKSGLEHGLYDHDFFELIQSVGITTPLAIIIIATGNSLFRSESALRIRHAELKASEAKFKALVEASAQIVWTTEADGHVVEDSPSWRAYTGQTYEECKGQGWLNALHEEDRAIAWAAWIKATRLRSDYSVEYRILHVSGEWRWMRARGTSLLNPNGQVSGWVGMNTDIHEEKNSEINLKNAKEEAERSNQLKSAFLANMSHEIRTPLGAILGFTELLNDPDLDGETQTDYVETIRRNGELLETIISDILDLSKVEAGQLVIEYLPTKPADILRDVVHLLEPKAREKLLTLSIDRDLPELSIESFVTDPTRLKQIMINIVGNALKFTSQGAVIISCRDWEEGEDKNKKGIVFAVQDTGIGIADEHRERIFDVFVQADNSMTRRFGGTGLGLSLSRRLARELGGDVIIQNSIVDFGTTFEIYIEDRQNLASDKPFAYVMRQMNVNASYSPDFIELPMDLGGLRILVVDDSPDNQMLISLLLSRLNVEIDCASDGLKAYEKTLEKQYDIILMDLQMPVMDGYAATHRLRSEGFTVPIIALTAHAMSDIKSKCMQVGFTDYLPKPINLPELLSAISKHTANELVSQR